MAALRTQLRVKAVEIFRLKAEKAALQQYLTSSQGIQSELQWRPSENPGHKKGDLVLYHDIDEIKTEVSNAYREHHQYDWIKPRCTLVGRNFTTHMKGQNA